MGLPKNIAKLIAYEIIAVIIVPFFILLPVGIGSELFFDLVNLFEKPWISTANSNAKLVYTNSAEYCTKCGSNNTRLPDGAYCISLTDNTGEDDINIKEKADGTPDSFYTAMLSLMGGQTHSGYCVILIKDNRPVISYWSVSAKILEYEDYLAYSAENGIDIEYSPPEVTIGCYPYELIGYDSSVCDVKKGFSPQITVYRSFTDKQMKKYIFNEKAGTVFSVIRIVLEILLITQFPLVVYLVSIRLKKPKSA